MKIIKEIKHEINSNLKASKKKKSKDLRKITRLVREKTGQHQINKLKD